MSPSVGYPRRMGKMSPRGVAVALFASVIGLAATGCSDASTDGLPTQACRSAAETAVAAEEQLYDTHPLWDAEVPGVDASPEEQAAYDALAADEEAQWEAIYAPVYADCTSPADWWAAAKEYPLLGGVTDAEFLDPASLTNWCTGNEGQPACTGVEEWLATNPS